MCLSPFLGNAKCLFVFGGFLRGIPQRITCSVYLRFRQHTLLHYSYLSEETVQFYPRSCCYYFNRCAIIIIDIRTCCQRLALLISVNLNIGISYQAKEVHMKKDLTIKTNVSISAQLVTKIARATVTFATDNKLTPKLLFCRKMLYTKSITI